MIQTGPRRRSSRRRKKRSYFKWVVVVLTLFLLAGIALAGSVVLGYNPFLESQLRAQFGDDFFTDFDNLPDTGDGADLEEIIDNYEPTFQALEDQALERLDSLFMQAIEEYHQLEQAGNVDRFVLTNKYIQAGRILEDNVDETFYELLGKMENELNSKGYSTKILEEIETSYEQAKDSKKRELMNRLQQTVRR